MVENKYIFSILVIVAIVAIVSIVGIIGFTNNEAIITEKSIAESGITGSAIQDTTKSEFKRVLITPHKTKDIPKIKSLVTVRHEFKGKFSADVPSYVLSKLETVADIEEIELYEIKARSVCGDGVIHPKEKCGEPGLLACPEGTVCQDCKCVIPSEEEGRTCFPSTQKPWGIVKVNGSFGGSSVTVSVLDTGVYVNHLDLDIALCKDSTKRGIRNGCKDRNGHGTHVAGIVAANAGSDSLGIYGVAPEINLWAVKVCGNDGSCWTDDIAAAIRYVTDQGTNIISMSLGGDRQSSLIKDAIDYATSQGVLVVAAAGNDGPDLGSIDYPGANVKVIAAGAIDSSEAVPFWSSRGVNDGDYVIEEREVEFGTPGVSIESTWNDGCYKTISGTSMSTPHVSGLAAKLWQGNALDTRIYLQELAKNHDLYTAGDDPATGFGLPIAP